MRNATFLRKMLWLLCLPLLFIACKDNMDEHYEVPDWVADNAWKLFHLPTRSGDCRFQANA